MGNADEPILSSNSMFVQDISPEIAEAMIEPTPGERHFERDSERSRKLRMLCLHGHGSNNQVTEIQLFHMMMQRVHGVSCDKFSATIETLPESLALAQILDGPFHTWFYPWWFKSGPWAVGQPGGSLHASLQRLLAVIKKHGPYDGVYGFSMGATMAALLCNPVVWRGLFGLEACPFRFAILVNAAACRSFETLEIAQSSTEFLRGARAGIATPGSARLSLPVERSVASLHLIGKQDWWYSKDSVELVKAFEDSVVRTHPNGHEVPMAFLSDCETHEAIADFLDRFDHDQASPDYKAVQTARWRTLGQELQRNYAVLTQRLVQMGWPHLASPG
jgi:hypothetical protein